MTEPAPEDVVVVDPETPVLEDDDEDLADDAADAPVEGGGPPAPAGDAQDEL